MKDDRKYECTGSRTGRVVDLAVRAEEWGLDGQLLADSELLVSDPYIELALAANATTRLRLGPAG